MVIQVELDGVVCQAGEGPGLTQAAPLPGAREALAVLRAKGHQVVITTARPASQGAMVEAWLQEQGIACDGLRLGLPGADRVLGRGTLPFTGWDAALETISGPEEKRDSDELLLHILRNETKLFLEHIARRKNLVAPVLEVGPMVASGAGNSSVFQRMPETFVDSRALFERTGVRYLSMDLDPSAQADYTGDFAQADRIVEAGSVGTAILLSCLEHMPGIWDVPRVLDQILKPGGLAFFLTPWNLRFHGPRPDCWRISDDGYQSLFGSRFEILEMEKIPSPGRPLSPVGMKCVVRKPA